MPEEWKRKVVTLKKTTWKEGTYLSLGKIAWEEGGNCLKLGLIAVVGE